MAQKQVEEPSLWERLQAWAQSILAESKQRKRSRRSDTTVRRTRQVTDSDCGVAALSMIADVTYTIARRALFRPGERCRGTTNHRMRKGLRTLNIVHAPRFRRFTSWGGIPGHALVHIRWRELPRTDPGHWVVYQKYTGGYRVLDPASFAETLSSSDTEPMLGQAYLLVTMVHRQEDRGVLREAPARARRRRHGTSKSPR